MDTQKRIIVWISAILVVGITAIAAWQIATDPKTPVVRAGTLSEVVSASDWTKGGTETTKKVELVEYSDFQCPACGMFYPLVEQIITEHKDTIAFTYRHFPLPQHKNALAAAYATEAAGAQGKFWEMHQMIFESQNDWSESDSAEATFEGFAGSLGLDLARFKTDRDSQRVKDKVTHDRETGLTSGVNSTPSFYLNGKKMAAPRSAEEFKATIEAALK
ncbi:MAG: DsbA family protein [Minisyncoccota bacterium]